MSVSLVASPNAFLQATAQPLWSSTYLARSERKWRGLSLNEATDPCRSTIPAHPRNRHPTYPSSHHCHPKVRPPPGRRRSMFSRSSVRSRQMPRCFRGHTFPLTPRQPSCSMPTAERARLDSFPGPAPSTIDRLVFLPTFLHPTFFSPEESAEWCWRSSTRFSRRPISPTHYCDGSGPAFPSWGLRLRLIPTCGSHSALWYSALPCFGTPGMG